MSKTAIVIGATGLVGSEVLDLLLRDDRYSKVKVFHRRSTGIKHPKLEEHIVDFDAIDDWKLKLTGDELYSALGTTIKKAGSQEKQYNIDYTYQFETAKAAAKNGVKKYSLVSSAGADHRSKVFYSRLKGELDRDVKDLSFEVITIMRPSILAGERNESRLGESIGMFFMKFVTKIPGLKKYRPILGRTVAQGMINSLHKCPPGYHIFELDEIFYL
ncbi:MAG: NADH-quinone oxidoreductase subunit F [Balneola sp.]|nr:NADH-quinone oxidoreductase subunit F [Balneola sp.]|tara:strand:- start:20051 stop:20698 length:648 start_codon:yes stop_codon:yes gene_type:complete